MKIAIVGGTGAMGGAIGACLHRGGHQVTLVDVNPVAVATVNEKGLTIEQKSGETAKYFIPATTEPESVGVVDLVVLFVKCYHTAAAISQAIAMVGPKTKVLSLQNGWGNGPVIAETVGSTGLFVGVTYHSASLIEPARVLHAGIGATLIGPLDGQVTPEAIEFAEGLACPDFAVSANQPVLEEIWKKLCLNICTLPTSGLLRFGASQLVAHEGTKALMHGLLTEAITVANAKGIAVDFDERWTTITELLARVGPVKSSMLQDVDARRRTEIDVINGAIVAAGLETGHPTPLNQSMVWLISALQESFA